jgi:myo-inositol-1(or 4)-monophosphatase
LVVDRRTDLERIATALTAAVRLVRDFDPESVRVLDGDGDDGGPVTELDHAVDDLLRRRLPSAGEGWLSEESTDDLARLRRSRVWIVDAIDGTHEMLAGVPEWCVSVGLVEDRRAVAGGVVNPATGETVLGAEGLGVTLDGVPARPASTSSLVNATVLASRSESARGEWDVFRDAPFRVVPTGSAAYKLARVAAGRADATWTFRPKREWDVAAGVALVLASGGRAWLPGGGDLGFNSESSALPGLVACRRGLAGEVRAMLSRSRQVPL